MKPTTNIGLKRHQGAQVLAAINEFLKSSESDIIDWNQIKDVFSDLNLSVKSLQNRYRYEKGREMREKEKEAKRLIQVERKQNDGTHTKEKIDNIKHSNGNIRHGNSAEILRSVIIFPCLVPSTLKQNLKVAVRTVTLYTLLSDTLFRFFCGSSSMTKAKYNRVLDEVFEETDEKTTMRLTSIPHLKYEQQIKSDMEKLAAMVSDSSINASKLNKSNDLADTTDIGNETCEFDSTRAIETSLQKETNLTESRLLRSSEETLQSFTREISVENLDDNQAGMFRSDSISMNVPQRQPIPGDVQAHINSGGLSCTDTRNTNNTTGTNRGVACNQRETQDVWRSIFDRMCGQGTGRLVEYDHEKWEDVFRELNLHVPLEKTGKDIRHEFFRYVGHNLNSIVARWGSNEFNFLKPTVPACMIIYNCLAELDITNIIYTISDMIKLGVLSTKFYNQDAWARKFLQNILLLGRHESFLNLPENSYCILISSIVAVLLERF